MDKNKRFKWRTQDWIWLLIVLIYAQGFAFMYNNYLMQVISYVSTFVSIALAAIAIYISIKEATNNDKMKNEIYILLNEVRSKVGDIDTKIDKYNPDDLKTINKEVVGEFGEDLGSDIKKIVESKSETDVANIENLINEKINEKTSKLVNNLNKVQEDFISESLNSSIIIRNHWMDAIKSFKVGEIFSVSDYRDRMLELTNSLYYKRFALAKLEEFVELGILKIVGSEFQRIK